MAASSRGPGRDVMVVEPAPVADKTPPVAAGRKELVTRIISSLILAPIAIGAAYAGDWIFGAFWLIAAIGVWWEWNALVSGPGNRLLFVLGSTSLALALAIAEIGRMTRTPMLIVALGALGAGVFARGERRTWTAGGLLYAGVILVAPVMLRRDPQLGMVAIFFLFAVVWATDVLGYFVGRALGGPKLVPRISPNKTWSGAIGGTLGAVLAGVAVARFAGLGNLFAVGLVAIVLSIAAQAGDLFESAVKRRFGAKDASQLIPGHGGFMDRLDGFAAAAAAAAVIGIAGEGLDAAAQGLLLW